MESMCLLRNVLLGRVFRQSNILVKNYNYLGFKRCMSTFKESKADSQEATESVTEGGEAVNEELKRLQDENKTLLEKISQIDDKYKRALAEAENTRVRMRRQVEEAKIYGIQKFSKDLLDVADVLEKASDAVPKEELNNNEHFKNLYEGVTLTAQQIQSVFRRHGLTKINPIGCKFDPNEHHAMFEAEIEGKEPGTVAEVIKVGYKLQDRTVRPAMVGVVKAKK